MTVHDNFSCTAEEMGVKVFENKNLIVDLLPRDYKQRCSFWQMFFYQTFFS